MRAYRMPIVLAFTDGLRQLCQEQGTAEEVLADQS